MRYVLIRGNYYGFRPLIRGFFFYMNALYVLIFISMVSVPSFGDSFFIIPILIALLCNIFREFPSPHSGILFLSAI